MLSEPQDRMRSISSGLLDTEGSVQFDGAEHYRRQGEQDP